MKLINTGITDLAIGQRAHSKEGKFRCYNQEEFFSKCIIVHGDTYDYSNTTYSNYKTKVAIICKHHGEFLQPPPCHLQGKGCPKCAEEKRVRGVRAYYSNKRQLPTDVKAPEGAKLVPLNDGFYAIIDESDYSKIEKHNWHVIKTKSTPYAGTNVSKGKALRMHRLIMGVTDPDLLIDHINHNGLDNRKQNLRLASSLQNIGNQRKMPGKSSRYKGVSWINDKKKWRASIHINKHPKHLGYFEDEQEAALVYNIAAKEYFGEFAWLNDIEAQSKVSNPLIIKAEKV